MACNAADFQRFRVSSWLSLVRLEGRASSILLSLVLAITGGLFGLEVLSATRAAAARNRVIRILPHRPLDTPVTALEEAIQLSVNALQWRPDDPELHQTVALWWIDRYRLQAFRELRQPLGDLSGNEVRQLWSSTSLPVLHARVAEIAAQDSGEQIAAVRRIPAIRSNLGHAYRHLLEASRLNPLMRDNPSTLAHLAILQDPSETDHATNENVDRFIKLALFLSPSEADELLRTGLLADSLHRVDLSHVALGRCLEVSEDHLMAIWTVLNKTAEIDELLDNVIPRRLDVLIALAEATTDLGEKEKLVSLSQKVANETNFSDSDDFSFTLQARLAELQGRKAEAIDAYREAIRLYPDEIESRLKLARLLAREGQLEEAENEYSMLRILVPKRRDIERELQDLRLRLD